jgi:hypothetical protein
MLSRDFLLGHHFGQGGTCFGDLLKFATMPKRKSTKKSSKPSPTVVDDKGQGDKGSRSENPPNLDLLQDECSRPSLHDRTIYTKKARLALERYV